MMVMEAAFIKAGYVPLKVKAPKPRKVQMCRKCGAPMEYIENTNVMVCTGDIETTSEGKVTSTPCLNKFIFSV